MNNADYWKDRFTQLENVQHNTSIKQMQDIQRAYERTQRSIEGRINAWYGRFASNNNIDIAEAKKWLNASELKELQWDIKDYIKYGKENGINQGWMKELESASAKYHINRLDALKLQLQQDMETLMGGVNDDIDSTLRKIYTEGYMHTAFEVQKGLGIGWNLNGIDSDRLNKIIKKPWAADGLNFSDRIWNNRQQLINSVHNALTQQCVLGFDPQKAIDRISKQFNVSKNQAGRLIMTESAFFGSESQKDCFNELGVEKYEIVATLDDRTSEICQEQDGQVYDMKLYEAGITAPPFHVYCRSCTAPYFDDEFSVGERVARDANGKTYTIPANTTYKEWKNGFVDNGSKDDFKSVIETPNQEYEQNVEIIKAQLHNVETERTSLNYEVGTIIDKKGNIINITNGEAHCVNPPEELLKDNIFTHNHPSGGCFSKSDIESMVDTGLLELRASTPQGTYYSLLRQAGANPSGHSFAEDFNKNTGITKASDVLRQDMIAGKITKAEVENAGFQIYVDYMSKIGISWLEENAEKYGYIFTQGVI